MTTQHLQAIFNNNPHKLVISNPGKKTNEFKRINIMPTGNYYQFEKFTDKQVFHENVMLDEVVSRCASYLKDDFKQLNAWDSEYEYNLKISKKGKVFFDKRRVKDIKTDDDQADSQVHPHPHPHPHSHNRKKNYLLEEGQQIPPLVDMGIFTKEGKVVSAMYDKYKQINRFLEIIDDVIKESKETELTIVDFGCGKSYLTFIMYYYFTQIRKMNITMVGVDQNEELIKQCNDAASKYNYNDLHFEMADINGFKYQGSVDMVISLHACDTATDYALYNAIKWDAGMIFSVPCCQHELNEQIKTDDFSLFTRYGLIKERMAALMTDSIRANLLECNGYKTQVLEFVDLAHTPKNILLRAVKKTRPKKTVEKAEKELENVISEFNLKPTLYTLLSEHD